MVNIKDVVVSSDTQNGRLVQVVTRVTTDKEAQAYQALINSDLPVWPACGKNLKP